MTNKKEITRCNSMINHAPPRLLPHRRLLRRRLCRRGLVGAALPPRHLALGCRSRRSIRRRSGDDVCAQPLALGHIELAGGSGGGSSVGDRGGGRFDPRDGARGTRWVRGGVRGGGHGGASNLRRGGFRRRRRRLCAGTKNGELSLRTRCSPACIGHQKLLLCGFGSRGCRRLQNILQFSRICGIYPGPFFRQKPHTSDAGRVCGIC